MRFRAPSLAAAVAAGLLAAAAAARPRAEVQGAQPAARVQVGAADIGGVVTGPGGPEAGVWVIAETDDLPTKYAKIVVTDDAGRYLLPGLPKARLEVRRIATHQLSRSRLRSAKDASGGDAE